MTIQICHFVEKPFPAKSSNIYEISLTLKSYKHFQCLCAGNTFISPIECIHCSAWQGLYHVSNIKYRLAVSSHRRVERLHSEAMHISEGRYIASQFADKLTSININLLQNFLPLQFTPFPLKPTLHMQLKLPNVLKHAASGWQLSVFVAHSSTSVNAK